MLGAVENHPLGILGIKYCFEFHMQLMANLYPFFFFLFLSSVTGRLPDPGQEIDFDAVKLLHIGGKKCKELKE